MRAKLEAAAGPRSLKRGPGGIVDVEFVVQLLQLKYGREHPDVLRSNTWDALDALATSWRAFATTTRRRLRDGYSFLRLSRGPAANRHRPAADRGARERRRPREARAPARVRLARQVPCGIEARNGRSPQSVRGDHDSRAKLVKMYGLQRRFRMCGTSHTGESGARPGSPLATSFYPCARSRVLPRRVCRLPVSLSKMPAAARPG